MGRMGMELGSAPRLLQPRILGRLVESLPSTAPLLQSATDCMGQPARLPWQLGLSPAPLSSSESSGARPSWESPWRTTSSTACAPPRQTAPTWKTRPGETSAAEPKSWTTEQPWTPGPAQTQPTDGARQNQTGTAEPDARTTGQAWTPGPAETQPTNGARQNQTGTAEP